MLSKTSIKASKKKLLPEIKADRYKLNIRWKTQTYFNFKFLFTYFQNYLLEIE